MSTTHAYALLIPLQEVHLIAAEILCAQQGKVAFGSRQFELFRKVDLSRYRDEVDVFLIATDPQVPIGVMVSWHGIYCGHVPAEGDGTHPAKARFRPYTDYENDRPGRWQIFWEMRQVAPIPPFPISSLRGFDQKRPYDSTFIPQTPLLIEHPHAGTRVQGPLNRS